MAQAVMQEIGDAFGIAFANMTVGWWLVRQGDAESGVRLLRDAHRRFTTVGARYRAAQSSIEMAVGMDRLEADLQDIRSLMQQAIDEARDLENGFFLAACLYWCGQVLLQLGEYSQARQANEEALRIERQLGISANTTIIVHMLANIAQITGDLNQAEALLQEAIEIERQENRDLATARLQVALAHVMSVQGRHERAGSLLDQANVRPEPIEFLYRRGEYAQALLAAERLVAGGASLHMTIRVALLRASIAARQGDAQAAEVSLQQALEPARRTSRRYMYGRAVFVAAEIRRAEEDLETAVELAALAFENPLTPYEYRQYAADLLGKLEAALSPVVYETAYARGAAADIDAVIAGLLSKGRA